MALTNGFLSILIVYLATFHALSGLADAKGEVFDFVIVGGGTSGLVVAKRLAEYHDYSVLVVEYGSHDNDPSVPIPGYYNRIPKSSYLNITTVPQQHLHGQIYPVAVGGALGGMYILKIVSRRLLLLLYSHLAGGSSVNRLFFSRGSRSDYDAWGNLGNKNWSWHNLLPQVSPAPPQMSPCTNSLH